MVYSIKNCIPTSGLFIFQVLPSLVTPLGHEERMRTVAGPHHDATMTDSTSRVCPRQMRDSVVDHVHSTHQNGRLSKLKEWQLPA